MPDEATRSWQARRAWLHEEYNRRREPLERILNGMLSATRAAMRTQPLRATVKGRLKSFEAFYGKLLQRSRLLPIEDPFIYLTDAIGLRVITPFLDDLPRAAAVLREHFRVDEVDDKGQLLTEREFAYDATHLLVAIPEELLKTHPGAGVRVAEVQLRTTLQDAWAEVEHELVYKADVDSVDQRVRRKLHALNATLSLADTIFQELRDHQRRRYATLERGITNLLHHGSHEEHRHHTELQQAELGTRLVEALEAHEAGRLDEAIALYSEVLAVQPTYAVFNHRGLAWASRGDYARAVQDFTRAITMAPDRARAWANRGMIFRSLGQPERALEDLGRAHALQPSWAEPLHARALTLMDMGQREAALADCEAALARRPAFPQALELLESLKRPPADSP